MADTANERLERPSSQVVITVPVSFSEKQREATKKAAQSAGLEVIELVDNATAAGWRLDWYFPTKSNQLVIKYSIIYVDIH